MPIVRVTHFSDSEDEDDIARNNNHQETSRLTLLPSREPAVHSPPPVPLQNGYNAPDIDVASFLDDDGGGEDEPSAPAKRQKLNDGSSKKVASNPVPAAHVSSRALPLKLRKSLKGLVAMSPNQMASEIQKMFLLTLGTTGKGLGFRFKPIHFVQLTDERDVDPIAQNAGSGSLDILRNFLLKHYKFVDGESEENAQTDWCNQCGNEGIGRYDERNVFYCNVCWTSYSSYSATKTKPKHKRSTKKKKKRKGGDGVAKDRRKELLALTKSMEILVISPNVGKAVTTVERLSDLKVTHNFMHKKRLRKLNKTQYDEYRFNEGQWKRPIPLRIARLFGKHRKIKEQHKELLRKSWHLGVGGIHRISKLCESKHLSLKNTKLLVIDLQKDAKDMSCWEQPMIRQQMVDFITTHAITHLTSKNLKILFF